MFNPLNWLFGKTKLYGAVRDPGWDKASKLWLKQHPKCFICKSKEGVVPHHIIPVGVDKTKELDPTNLITFCPRCHLYIGHSGDFRKWNPNCLEDAERDRKRFETAPWIGK